MKEIIYSRETHLHIRNILGKRPGNYHTDPYYLRRGMGDKPYFWNTETRKWELLRNGDQLIVMDDGSVIRIPVGKSVA